MDSMIPILLLILLITTESGVDVHVEQIQFTAMESCQNAADKLERELIHLNAQAICIERTP